jgi:outer membrane protein TolC
VSQEIPFPGKRALRREQADSEARSEAFRLRNLELSLIARLKTAYHEWRGIDDQFRALDRQAEVIRQLESAGEARYATGGGRQQDLWMVRLESIQLDARRIPLRHRQSALLAEIGALVDLPPDSLNLTPTPDLALPPPPEPVSLAAAARRSSPVTAEQRVEVDVRRTGVEIARRDYYPDFEIMAGYYNMGRMKDMWEAQVRINIPLWFADRQRPALEESVARLTAAERRVRAVETDLAAKIAANPPLSVRQIKNAVYAGQDLTLDQLLEWVSNAFAGLSKTEDHQEAVRAFLEKRPPRFQGR